MLVTPADMSAFIQFLSDVTRVEGSVPHMETRLTTITNLYNVAQQFDVRVCEEEMALYKSLFTRFRQLKVCLLCMRVCMCMCITLKHLNFVGKGESEIKDAVIS